MTTDSPIMFPNRTGRRVWIALAMLAAVAITFGVGIKIFSNRAAQSADKGEAAEETPDLNNGDSHDEKPQSVRLSPEVARKYGIRVGVAKKRKLVFNIVAPARVSFNNEATAVVGSPIQGRVVEIKARAGDRVEKRAEMLVLESAELGEAQSDYLQKHTAAATAESIIEPLKSMYARVKKLYAESEGVSLTELQKREVELRQAEGSLANAEAGRIAAENKLNLLGMNHEGINRLLQSGNVDPHYIVRSPLSGQVIERNVNLGELVKPDREKLFVVADTKTLWVLADVPESRAREIANGATARISVAATADQSFPGTVSYVAASIDPQTRSLQVRIEVASNPALKPGMFAQADIDGKADSKNAEPVLAVPESAIQTVNGNTAVFVAVKNEEDTFKMHLVKTGACVDGQTCILSGLGEGEHIVTGGSSILKAELLKGSAKDED